MLLPLLLVLSLPLGTPAPDALPPRGLDTPATAGVQLLVGGVACFATNSVLSIVPIVGPIVSTLAIGTIVGGAETATGDAIGQSRSAMVWPVVTSTTIFVAGSVASVLVSIDGARSAPEALLAVLLGGPVQTAIGAASGIVGVAVPVIAYHLTAVPKENGDPGGLSIPGFLVPSDPTNSRDPPATTPAVTPPTTTTPTDVMY
jgi:hypothetical protein